MNLPRGSEAWSCSDRAVYRVMQRAFRVPMINGFARLILVLEDYQLLLVKEHRLTVENAALRERLDAHDRALAEIAVQKEAATAAEFGQAFEGVGVRW